MQITHYDSHSVWYFGHAMGHAPTVSYYPIGPVIQQSLSMADFLIMRHNSCALIWLLHNSFYFSSSKVIVDSYCNNLLKWLSRNPLPSTLRRRRRRRSELSARTPRPNLCPGRPCWSWKSALRFNKMSWHCSGCRIILQQIQCSSIFLINCS